MKEEIELTPEEKLHKLIIDGTSILLKLKKTLNIFIIVMAPLALAFFWSFVDVQKTQTSIQKEKLSIVDANSMFKEFAEKYATKTSVIFLQNDIYDMNNSYYSPKKGATEQKMELSYTRALREFNGDVSRGEVKQIN